MHKGLMLTEEPAVPLRGRTDEHSSLQDLLQSSIGTSAITVRSFPKGAHIVWSEQPSDRIYFLKQGWLCFYQVYRSGRRQILNFAINDAIVGLEWAPGTPAAYSVQALTDCQVASVDRKLLVSHMARAPQIGLRIALHMSSTMSASWERLANICGRQATSRVAYALLDLFVHVRYRVPVTRGDEIGLPITQEDLADALGLTVVHVNRTLRALKEDGIVTFRAGKLRVLDPDRLADVAEYEPALA